MKLFNLFKRQKKMTIKKSFAPVLDKMWVCVINFQPWNPERHEVVFKEVSIVKACADESGIYVESDEKHSTSDYQELNGYIDKITSRFDHWVGFFETKGEAEQAYNKLMKEWIRVIVTKMVPEETKMVKED